MIRLYIPVVPICLNGQSNRIENLRDGDDLGLRATAHSPLGQWHETKSEVKEGHNDEESWCGEVRDVIFSDDGSVTVVYRVTIRGSDGEAYRESTGTVSSSESNSVDPVAAAEEIAFVRACARFGLGLILPAREGLYSSRKRKIRRGMNEKLWKARLGQWGLRLVLFLSHPESAIKKM
ncbi:hypothetical protein Cgig2_032829 [Carnegiea gigantea]|uniref:Uncharacterized protein n=1 Tax=Carnegiea gigantea TaxID=171969 RepID=A0A9Q1GMN4_9CARY|nr:hypothetical protein Cgig2_032829 [Carnegiea gigantea]